MLYIYHYSGTWYFGKIGEYIMQLRSYLFNPYLHIVSMLLYSIFLWAWVRSFGKSADSETDLVKINWVNTLLKLILLFIFAFASYYVLIQFPFFNRQWDYMICLTMSFSIYAIGYFVFKEPSIFNGELFQPVFFPSHSEKDSFDENLMDQLHQQLLQNIDHKKPYLNPDLRLTNLADQLNISSHLLSQVINQRTGSNFNQFINDFRLEEAEKLLIEFPNKSIKEIYYEVGFNNKATFYTAFKNRNHMTPSAFRNQQPTVKIKNK